jgi:hypothetical protein
MQRRQRAKLRETNRLRVSDAAWQNSHPSEFQNGSIHLMRSRVKNVMRVLLATSLLGVLLSSIAPLASVSAGSMCKLSCCASRAPHAAGSCRDGSCQASLLASHKIEKHQRAKPEKVDHFCGLSRQSLTRNFGRLTVAHAFGSHKANLPTSWAAAFVKPCQSGCGGSCGLTNSNQRNLAAVIGPGRPQDPAAAPTSDGAGHHPQLLSAMCRQGAPRGPPFFPLLIINTNRFD